MKPCRLPSVSTASSPSKSMYVSPPHSSRTRKHRLTCCRFRPDNGATEPGAPPSHPRQHPPRRRSHRALPVGIPVSGPQSEVPAAAAPSVDPTKIVALHDFLSQAASRDAQLSPPPSPPLQPRMQTIPTPRPNFCASHRHSLSVSTQAPPPVPPNSAQHRNLHPT